ncbi:hypothetical protein EDB89DRAFT_1850369 [Lactarius sanguifluus]|nr:hypothetical protein EDB89DRAFT_1850369 [Lactarius sanguifluus]
MQFFFTLLSFVALASAYRVTSPGGSSGWTIAGPNVVTWERVGTDALNFTIVLSNQAQTPSYQQVLAALVDGTLGKFTVRPPSTGFPTGTGFQVNLVEDSESLSTIYAQSQQFSIVQATTTTSSSLTATTRLYVLFVPSRCLSATVLHLCLMLTLFFSPFDSVRPPSRQTRTRTRT